MRPGRTNLCGRTRSARSFTETPRHAACTLLHCRLECPPILNPWTGPPAGPLCIPRGVMSGKLFDLTGRVGLVSGAAQGLGRAMAVALAEAGADVLLADRNAAGVQKTA